jgi:hypothetical protein
VQSPARCLWDVIKGIIVSFGRPAQVWGCSPWRGSNLLKADDHCRDCTISRARNNAEMEANPEQDSRSNRDREYEGIRAKQRPEHAPKGRQDADDAEVKRSKDLCEPQKMGTDDEFNKAKPG